MFVSKPYKKKKKKQGQDYFLMCKKNVIYLYFLFPLYLTMFPMTGGHQQVEMGVSFLQKPPTPASAFKESGSNSRCWSAQAPPASLGVSALSA